MVCRGMMKKLLLLPLLVVGFVSGASADMVDVLGVSCEVVAVGDKSASQLAKCPIVPELEMVQKEMANVMFLEDNFNGQNFKTFVNEKDFIWVNVIVEGCGQGSMSYRILVKDPVFDGKTLYAIEACV